MNRTKKFMFNTSASVFQQISYIIIGLILPRVILSVYGSVINGVTTSITQFITYFNLVEAGIGASAVYALYKPLAKNDYRTVSAIVVASKKFYIFSGYLFSGLIILSAFGFPLIRKTSLLEPFEIGILVLVLGGNGIINFFTLSKFYVLLIADQRYYVISISSMISNILNAVIIVFSAYCKISIVIAETATLVTIPVRAIIAYYYVHKYYAYINYHEQPDNTSMNQRWDALYQQILGVVQAGTPVILATIFLDYQSVSVYAIYYMVIGGINGLLSIFTSGLSASFGDVITRGEKQVLQRTYKEFEFTYYALITVVYACAAVLIMPFIRIYTKGITDTNYDVPIVGLLIVLNGFLYNLKTPQGMLVISAGLYHPTRWQTTIQGAIALIAGIVLAPKFGLPGILVGSILSNVYRDIDLLFFIPKHVTKLSPILTLKRWAYLFPGFFLIMLPYHFVSIKALSFFQWAGWGAVWVCYAATIMLVFSLLFDRMELSLSTARILKMLGVKKQ